MSIIRRKPRTVPRLNTAALPDLIFTVLFFFMIVTHMRTDNLKVKFQQPQGTQLTRLTKKTTVSHIYIGKRDGDTRPSTIQLNDKIVAPDDIADLIDGERSRMTPAERGTQTISIKADRNTPVGTLNQVKQALRQARATRISYDATEERSHIPNPAP